MTVPGLSRIVRSPGKHLRFGQTVKHLPNHFFLFELNVILEILSFVIGMMNCDKDFDTLKSRDVLELQKFLNGDGIMQHDLASCHKT